MKEASATYDRSELVLPVEVWRELERFIACVRHHDAVTDQFGGPRVASRQSALFVGPPGTGKTMAAQVVARTLGLSLRRVELSAVVSKYVGETEKNLDRIFDAVEGKDTILLFDEADALFGKRTDVNDSGDRYADMEVAHLLQRFEALPGPLILASNRKQNIDQAFMRRLGFVIEFPWPNEEERRKLWQRMLPPNHPGLSDEVLDELARGFHGSGAEIRTIIDTAAMLAAETNASLSEAHLRVAVRRALETGGVMPSR